MTDLAKHLLAASAAVFAAGSAVVFAAGAAHAKDITVYAEPAENALTRRVSFADLDLASQQGQDKLKGRVSRAVSFVCSPLDGPGVRLEMAECRTVAWSGAKGQMAQAIERARQIAAVGSSSIAPVAISVQGAVR